MWRTAKTLSKNRELCAFKHDGFWHPMDTLRDKNYLNDLWIEIKRHGKSGMIDQNFWADKKVLVTGHTGFKGSWLVFG